MYHIERKFVEKCLKQMLKRHISAALDIDNAMYCKIERGDRQAKRE